MAGISTTGLGLPTPNSAFGTSAAATVTPAGTQSGLLVQGNGGSTTLPAASPQDFQGTNPTPLDQPHPQFPTLIQSHVAVLQAIGTPEAVITQLAQQQPQAAYLDRYIQGEIMQNPEGWDDYVGNPRGTARAGLQQLMPGVQLPQPGAGSPGYLPDGSTVSGINVPGITQPLVTPSVEGGGEGNLVKGVLIGAAAIGIGVLGWKFLNSRTAAQAAADPARAAVQAFASGSGTAAAGGSVAGAAGAGVEALGSIQTMGRQLMNAGVDSGDLELVKRGMTLGVLGGGGGATGGATAAATADSILNGMGPANGFLNSVGISALHFDLPMNKAIDAALAHEWMGIARRAVDSGQLADFAATQVAMRQALQGTAESAATPTGNAALRNLLASAANAIPV